MHTDRWSHVDSHYGLLSPSTPRQAVLRRRNSLTERSSKSPEREASYNPPTLPRRTHGGPPAFKPVPPPAEGEQRPAFSKHPMSRVCVCVCDISHCTYFILVTNSLLLKMCNVVDWNLAAGYPNHHKTT